MIENVNIMQFTQGKNALGKLHNKLISNLLRLTA